MNTVLTFLWGGWETASGGLDYAHALYSAVMKHLSCSCDFVVLTDRHEDDFDSGIRVVPLKYNQLQMNHKKLEAFRDDIGIRGPVISMDLDTVIVSDFADLFEGNHFLTCEDPYHVRWPGGGVNRWNGSLEEELLNPVITDPLGWMVKTHGSERMFFKEKFAQWSTPCDFWQRRFPGRVVSYKMGCRQGLPDGASIIWFHGMPRPHHVAPYVDWVQENWTPWTPYSETSYTRQGTNQPVQTGKAPVSVV